MAYFHFCQLANLHVLDNIIQYHWTQVSMVPSSLLKCYDVKALTVANMSMVTCAQVVSVLSAFYNGDNAQCRASTSKNNVPKIKQSQVQL